ncbi:hypothetical protein LCGC14_0623180 [marine sediment metagenome]|uniref:Uncharacterized protein n=1 Tax=marine sediment metagenome TaxID=412755 RepID=A0A0F9TQL1_9ZZZZ
MDFNHLYLNMNDFRNLFLLYVVEKRSFAKKKKNFNLFQYPSSYVLLIGFLQQLDPPV